MPGKRDLNLTLERSEQFLREAAQKAQESIKKTVQDNTSSKEELDQ